MRNRWSFRIISKLLYYTLESGAPGVAYPKASHNVAWAIDKTLAFASISLFMDRFCRLFEQFEDAYAPQRLNNWQVPKNFTERPRIRHGATRAIADDGGHFTAHHHHGHSSGRKNNLHLRFQVK